MKRNRTPSWMYYFLCLLVQKTRNRESVEHCPEHLLRTHADWLPVSVFTMATTTSAILLFFCRFQESLVSWTKVVIAGKRHFMKYGETTSTREVMWGGVWVEPASERSRRRYGWHIINIVDLYDMSRVSGGILRLLTSVSLKRGNSKHAYWMSPNTFYIPVPEQVVAVSVISMLLRIWKPKHPLI